MTDQRQPRRLDAREVERMAAGHWDTVFQSLTHELDAAIAAAKRSRQVPCPMGCGPSRSSPPSRGAEPSRPASETADDTRAERKRSVAGGSTRFRFFRDWAQRGVGICNHCGAIPPLKLLQAVLKLPFPDVLAKVHEVLTGEDVSRPAERVVAQKPIDADRAARQRAKLSRLWEETVPLDAPAAVVARSYLENRGLASRTAWPAALRFHPNLPYWEATDDDRFVQIGSFPALLAVMSDLCGHAVTMHRIYLAPDGSGKADVPEAKKMIARPEDRFMTGGAIRLGPCSSILNLAEGVETAFAVMEITGQACWATYSATLLKSFVPPAGTRVVCVWGDKDVSTAGETHGEALIQRLRQDGYRAVGFLPPDPIPAGAKGVDWLDALVARKASGQNVQCVFRPLLTKLAQLLTTQDAERAAS